MVILFIRKTIIAETSYFIHHGFDDDDRNIHNIHACIILYVKKFLNKNNSIKFSSGGWELDQLLQGNCRNATTGGHHNIIMITEVMFETAPHGLTYHTTTSPQVEAI